MELCGSTREAEFEKGPSNDVTRRGWKGEDGRERDNKKIEAVSQT